MSPTLIIAAIAAVLSGLGGFGAAWTLQGREIDSLQMEAKDERIAIYRANRVALERAAGQITEAQAAAKVRADRLAADLGVAAAERDRLRHVSTAAVRAAAADPAACGGVVATFGDVYTESLEFIQTVVRDADQCISDRQTLMDAWPD